MSILLYIFFYITIIKNIFNKSIFYSVLTISNNLITNFKKIFYYFYSSKSIDEESFNSFMKVAYLRKKRYIKRIRDLYLSIDVNDSNSISLNEFFDLIDIIEKNP